jgi:hypothetical protein
MGKGERNRMSKEEKPLPEGTYRLTRFQLHAVSDVFSARQEMANRRKHWEEHGEKVLVPAERTVAQKIEEVFDDLCEQHGIARDGREIVVSKDMTTFTLKEQTDGESNEGREGQQEKPVLFDGNGNPLGGGPERPLIAGSLRPVGGRVTPEDAGTLLRAVEADRDRRAQAD